MIKLFEESKIYVYEDESILGFVGCKGNYISWLFVHPENRNMNIGRTLVEHLLSTMNGTVALTVAASKYCLKETIY